MSAFFRKKLKKAKCARPQDADERKRYCVGITVTPESTVARMCQEVILVDVQEQGSYEEKIDTFAVYSAFHFILDCMFSFLYQLDFESNKKETQEKAYSIKESKKQE